MPLVAHSENTARILVVDDNPTNVVLLSSALKKCGYEVLTAENGTKAIEVARRQRPDLILLDIEMPERDGFEVCNVLKTESSTATIPIIFVTATTHSETIVRALSTGGCDYITKPFLLNEVLARVSVQLRLKKTERELLKRNQELEVVSSKLQEVNEELARLTRIDPLTGLLNRRAWQEAAQHERERANRFSEPFSICMLDADYFKRLNDSLGHQAGDACLITLADAIQKTCRFVDVIGRYGGEEFVILLPGTDMQGAYGFGERLRQAVFDLAMPHPDNPVADRITISVGVATYASDPWEEIVKRADDALYLAKRTGRNTVCADLNNSTHVQSQPQTIMTADRLGSQVLPHIAPGGDRPIPQP
jgi:diguanylate cyclase (GGDEF)-like protein